MSEDIRELYKTRLGRYQAAIALETPDRIPIASGTNFFSEEYAGYNRQEIIYDSEKWLEADKEFIKAFPETDALRNNRIWAPLYDTVGLKTYRLPGRDLKPDIQFQFIEKEYMLATEYPLLVNNPAEFLLEIFIPRVMSEMETIGSNRANMAFLKGGIAHMMMLNIIRTREAILENELGMPQPMSGVFVAPFDLIGDALRGLNGIMMDIHYRPDEVIEACDVLVDEMFNLAMTSADPLKRYPIFVPTHKACCLSPKQFERFYWPSFKKVLEKIINQGYKIRAFLEGDWEPYWDCMTELPKGSVICDIDLQGNIFQAKKDFGYQQCIAGGLEDSLFTIGNPQEMQDRVKLLCETVGKDGGFIINGGCNIPYKTKPENYRAMIDATLKYGYYDKSIKPNIRNVQAGNQKTYTYRTITPWEVKSSELGEILGNEEMIEKPWNQIEAMAYAWLWQWAR